MRWLAGALALATPFLVYAGLRWFEPRALVLAIGALLLLRLATRWRTPTRAEATQLGLPALVIGAIGFATWLWNDPRGLLLLPVAINLGLLFGFARTLRNGPPMVETFARLQVADLPPDEVRYCRDVTVVWCVFFAINASISGALAASGNADLWLLYTGLLAYLAVGVLFAVEFSVRAWRFGRHEGTLLGPLYRRIFALLGHVPRRAARAPGAPARSRGAPQ